jgi:NarL family two-component system response regulator LiaR
MYTIISPCIDTGGITTNSPAIATTGQPPHEAATINIVIVHECPMVCAGIRSVLKRNEKIQIIGETIEYELILALITQHPQPDVVLMDGAVNFCLFASCGIDLVAQVRSAGVRGIIILAPLTDVDKEDLLRCQRSGAAAYELPTISGKDLEESIQRVARGETLIASVEPFCESEQLSAIKEPDTTADLTHREIQVLQGILDGLSNKEIGIHLKISASTVKNYTAGIFRKLDVRDRTGAVVCAFRHNLLTFESADAQD